YWNRAVCPIIAAHGSRTDAEKPVMNVVGRDVKARVVADMARVEAAGRRRHDHPTRSAFWRYRDLRCKCDGAANRGPKKNKNPDRPTPPSIGTHGSLRRLSCAFVKREVAASERGAYHVLSGAIVKRPSKFRPTLASRPGKLIHSFLGSQRRAATEVDRPS